MITNLHQENVTVLEYVSEMNMIKEGFVHQSNTPKMSRGADCIKSRYSTIEEGLETSISNDSSKRIMRILNEIKSLSDVEKLLLYLKLPTGAVSDDTLHQTPPSCVQGSNRLEQAQAFTWIKSHLEEDPDICLPKQEVYDDYRLYCENHYLRPLCTADFGKVMKCVFPNVKPRRLGQRGQSRYCYGGLRKKLDVDRPMLPELELQTPKPEDETKEGDEVFSAACQLVCEWAFKLLNKTFSGIRDLAEFLLTNLYVNSKSVAAFTLIAAMQDAGHQGLKTSALFATSSSDKHRETQIQLQRKLQERELMKEQKRRLQLQKEEVEQELRQAQERSQSRLQVHDRTTPVKTPIFQRYQETTQKPDPICRTPVLENERESKTLIQQSPGNIKIAHFVPVMALSSQSATTDTSPADSAAETSKNSTMCSNQTKSNIGSNELLRRLRNQIVDGKVRTEKNQCLPLDVATERSNNKIVKKKKNDKCAIEEEKNLIGESSQSILGCSGEFKLQNTDHMEVNQELSTNDPAVFAKGNSECKHEGEDFSDMEVDKLDLLEEFNKVGQTSSQTASECSNQMIETVNYVDNTLNRANMDQFHLDSYGDKENNNCAQQSCSDLVDTEMTEKSLMGDNACDNKTDTRWDVKPNERKLVPSNLGSSGTLYTPHPAAACRSAFVPFSQVQPRKEGISVNQNVSITKEPNQAVNYKTALQHSNPVTSEGLLSCAQSMYTNSIPVIIPSYNLQKSISSNSTQVDAVPVSNCSPLVIPATRGIAALEINPAQDRTSSHVQIQAEINGTSVPYQVTSPQSSSAQSVHSPSSIQSSPISSRNVRSRFTPIRPKASPSKTVSSMLKENRGSATENPAYDKRPVATILKEKRAREAVKAESLAKLNLPVAQFSQSLLTTAPTQGGSFQAIPDVIHIPTKEVVIILNSSPATNTFSVPQATGIASVKHDAKTNSAVRVKSSSNSPKIAQIHDKMEIEESPKVQSGVCSNQRKDQTISNSTEPMESQQMDDPQHRIVTVNTTSPFQPENAWSFGQESPIKSARVMLMTSSSEDIEDIQLGRETPLKLARVGDSPLDARPQSVCSLGWETPTDPSRSDSVCSFGRETPSGGRKRKSSDISLRQNFKRLNSTGENDELVDFEFPHHHHFKGQKGDEFQRRTQSCTLELDLTLQKDSRPEKEFHVLQSPDISSLERDALKDSTHITPYPLPNTRQEQMQRSSVGVCVKSLRNSQKQLMKQKDDLDKRMKNFMQKENQGNTGKMNMDKDNRGTSVDIVERSTKEGRNSTLEGLVSVHFEEQGVRIVDETLQNIQSVQGQKCTLEGNSEVHSVNREEEYHLGAMESDLPQDVADFITETLEKQRQSLAFTKKQALPDLVTGVENEIEIIVEQENSVMSSVCKSGKAADEDVFTVPDPLPPGQRVKDVVTLKQSPNKKDSGRILYTGHHRSCSLPNFTPFVEAVSHSIPRSSSISPQLVSEVSPLRDSSASPSPHNTSAMKPFLKEQPKSIPLPSGSPHHGNSVFIQTAVEMHSKPSPTFVKSLSHSTSNQNKVPEEHLKSTPLPYLASIQHSLQKPKDVSQDKLVRKTVSCSPVLNRQNSRENSIERLNSQTPFSDPGYHSIDTSPVLNFNPVSVLIEADSSLVSSNTGIQSTDLANLNINHPIQSKSLHQSPQSSCTLSHISVTNTRLSASLGSQSDPVISSAFMPIQATSLNSVGYVTPIKPLVTVANSNSLNPEDGHPSQSPNTGTESAMNIIVGNPPPYEAAVRSLRKDVQTVDANTMQSSPVTKQMNEKFSLVRDPQRKANVMREKPGVSTANMNARNDNSIPGNPQDTGEQKKEPSALLTSPLSEAYPFSFKLAQLSTKSSDDKSQSIARPTGLLATMNVSTVHGHSKDIPAKKASLHNQSEPKSITLLHSGMFGTYPKEVGSNAMNKESVTEALANISMEKSQFKGAVSLAFPLQSSSNIPLTNSIYSNIELPDARFMGNSPNVDISSALTSVTSSSSTDMLFQKQEYSAKRNLQFRLDEDELRTTLDDLRSLDGQYFQQGEFSPCLREEVINEDLDLTELGV